MVVGTQKIVSDACFTFVLHASRPSYPVVGRCLSPSCARQQRLRLGSQKNRRVGAAAAAQPAAGLPPAASTPQPVQRTSCGRKWLRAGGERQAAVPRTAARNEAALPYRRPPPPAHGCVKRVARQQRAAPKLACSTSSRSSTCLTSAEMDASNSRSAALRREAVGVVRRKQRSINTRPSHARCVLSGRRDTSGFRVCGLVVEEASWQGSADVGALCRRLLPTCCCGPFSHDSRGRWRRGRRPRRRCC